MIKENELQPVIIQSDGDYVRCRLGELYLKDEVDEYVKKLEAKNRRLKRALYKACANWAIQRACILEYFRIVFSAKKWERMYHRCIEKVEADK